MCHVLIIEDEPMIALSIEAMLEDQGATSFAFAAGEGEAVAAAIERRPTIITSDVTLAEGTGPAAVAAIRHRFGPLPVIFITGTPDAGLVEAAGTIVLAKPVTTRTVVDAFHRLMPSCS